MTRATTLIMAATRLTTTGRSAICGPIHTGLNTRREEMKPGPILTRVLLGACSVDTSVAAMGFLRTGLLRFLRRIHTRQGLGVCKGAPEPVSSTMRARGVTRIALCVAECERAVWTVSTAATGFSRPNLLRFSCRVQCGRGLRAA